MEPGNQTNQWNLLQGDFNDFFDEAICGFVITDGTGSILRANKCIAAWLSTTPAELTGKRFSDLLSIGGKIYYETHLSPLLRMQGYFDEVALELSRTNGKRQEVFINAYERRNDEGQPQFVRYTIFKGSDRRQYELNLQQEKITAENNLATEQEMAQLREQFIAVLGHDLRNPLGSITAAADLLARSNLPDTDQRLVSMVKRSGLRMSELIENIMDFARVRLGSGLSIKRELVKLEPLLSQVIHELRTIHTGREIQLDMNFNEPVYCDPNRLSQLLSNLIANALTHGSPHAPVYVHVTFVNEAIDIAVSNTGKPIPEEFLSQLFHPFTREPHRPSQHGLGLGLYIASEIAKVHDGKLVCVSDDAETRFTLSLPLNK
jgi:phosphoserine phosphatase RsbU/P